MPGEACSDFSCKLDRLLAFLPDAGILPAFVLSRLEASGRVAVSAACPDPAYSASCHVECASDIGLGMRRCARGCCLAMPLVDGGSLALVCERPLSPEHEALFRLALGALARELEQDARLRELEQGLEFDRSIVRSMSSGFLVLLPDLTVRDANPAACALLQTTERELIGGKLSDVIFSELQVKKVFTTGKAITDLELFIKLRSKELHILKTAVPVFGADGSVIAVLDHFREIKEARQLVNRMSGARASFTFDDIVHAGRTMADVIELGRMAAANSLSVLISGESGTGKELFAHAIHMAGDRCNAPFVVIDCASMPRELVASELFGYVEGAFTGARKGGMPGKFELASGGTIFLDELGELPLEIQAQFLRVLQTRQVTRLCGKTVLPVDIRIIAATNRDLEQEVRQGNFREDLFYRLNVLSIHIPPLRSRPEDIAPLAEYFTSKYCAVIDRPHLRLSPAALQALRNDAWPGNVRELENAIARAVHSCAGDSLEPEHVLPGRRAAIALMPPLMPQDAVRPSSFRDMEIQAFHDAITASNGNISHAARRLGVARSTVYKKMAAWKRDGLASYM